MNNDLKRLDPYPEERATDILEKLREQGRVSVSELSQELGVSQVTVRADLQALADRKLIVRTYGGAIPASRGLADLSLARREQLHAVEKARIGQAGADLVSDGDAIFLDISSTALAISHHLRSRRQLTVITNSLAVAQDLMDATGVTVVMAGGIVDRETASLGGTMGLDCLRAFNIQKGFFGLHGISIGEGLTAVSTGLAEARQVMIQMCRQVIAVLDASKWGKVGLVSFASLQDVDCIITDSDAPTDLVERVRALGIQVILA
jgi:DeoR/GlpR family transcriptional regulator of sugar metabolism